MARPRATATVLLDTYDGRLYRAGYRLAWTDTERPQLNLRRPDGSTSAAVAAAPPDSVAALRPSGVRTAVDGVVGARALLPVVTLRAVETEGVLLGDDRRPVAKVTRRERVERLERLGANPVAAIAVVTLAVEPVGRSRRTAATIVADLVAAGIELIAGDGVDAEITAAGVDMRGLRTSPTVPLAGGMPASEGFVAVLSNLANTISATWQGTLDDAEIEFLHELRIAVRRTRAVLGHGKNVLPRDVLREARRQFAWLGRATGVTRDLDVYLEGWQRSTEPLGPVVQQALMPARSVIERRRQAAFEELATLMRSPDGAGLLDRWRSQLDALAIGSDPADAPQRDRPLDRLIAKRVTAAHARLIDHGRLITATSPAEQLHDLRKDAKQLRYVVECFGGLYPTEHRRRYGRRLKALQTNLGEHQDAEVQMVMVDGIARELHAEGVAADTLVALGRLEERLDQTRRAARADFAEHFAAFDTDRVQRSLTSMLESAR